jgi:hypothetical protein
MKKILVILIITGFFTGCVSEEQVNETDTKPVNEQDAVESEQTEQVSNSELSLEDIINMNLREIDMNSSGREEIINIFGAPQNYKGSQVCQVQGTDLDLCPQSYWMIYSDKFKIHMVNKYIDFIEISFYDFLLPNNVRTGMSIEDVFSIINKPSGTVKENPGSMIEKGILYEFYTDGIVNHYFEEENSKYAYYFISNVLIAVYMSGSTNHYEAFINSLQEKLDSLDINRTVLADIINTFGEPVSYEWTSDVYSADSLPEEYMLTYPGVLHFVMENDVLKEIRIFDNYYTTVNGLKTGMPVDKAIDAAGEPEQIIDSVTYMELVSENVLYTNVNSTPGLDYWKIGNMVLWFSTDRIHSIILISEF